ncbi:hypothetical protein M758_12G068300 [Ceratodon purpureus]|nr:hypothetical protein M758_12G068300 [Ceratodon purpureus]
MRLTRKKLKSRNKLGRICLDRGRLVNKSITVMELPSRFVWWDLNSRQHLQHEQQRRSFLLVCGADAAQDVRAITLFKSLWPTYPSLSVLWSSYEGRTGGQIRCSPLSVRKRSSRSRNAAVHSGEAQTTEQVWEEYFVDPSQWWDNRVEKKNPRAPDFKHKATGKALWVDGWYTPAWVKARLKANPMTQGYEAKDSQGAAQPNRHNGEDGGGSMHMQRASTMNEAITIVKNHLQQGIRVDSYMYVELLKRCLKQTDLKAAKEVHDCIIKSQMEQNVYVANNLLSVYIRCGNLHGARQVFDSLGKKDVISWNVMIGGYAQRRCAEEAMAIFNQMRQENVQADEITYLSILKACASPLALKWGREVHMHIKHDAFESDVRVGTALLKMYTNCGSIKEARQFFDDLTDRNVISWNVMVGAYAESGCGLEAYELYLQMLHEGFEPDAITYLCILKASASAGALEWVKEVHRHIREAGFESDVRVGNALVHKYAKSGSVDDARLVFDRMEERDVITWNVMIGAYAESGRGVEAYHLYLQMKGEGFQPDAVTYLSILNACASAGSFEWVKEVHSHAFKDGLGSNVRVCSALVHMYAKSGNIDKARLVFDRMKERNVITWNIMIGAYAESGRGVEAYDLYLQMKRKGNKPDAVTYVSILNACASAGAFEWVKEIHSHALSEGLESDVRVGSALIHMYAKIGSIDDAQIIFDRMKKRNIITWTAIIGAHAESGHGVKAYQLYLQMKREGFQPDAITYASILNACASAGALEWVKDVHSHVQEAGLESDLHVGSALVHMYSKSGSIDDAQIVFDRMKERNVITWTVIIGAYAENGRGVEAYKLYLQMKREGFQPDAITYLSILKACASAGALEWVKDVHSHVREAGLESDLRVGKALVHVYAKSGNIDDARLVFDRMKERDVITWNVMIGVYTESGCGVEAYELYLQMLREGFKPDTITYVCLLNASASAGAMEWVKEVHSQIQEAGFESDLRVGNALVHKYAKSGSVDDARLVFDRMEERDVITWTAMIGAYAESGRGVEAYHLYLQMKGEGFQPDAVTYLSILNACASAGSFEWVKTVQSHLQKAGLESDLRVANALVHMYAKSGNIDEARLVFDKMEERDVITWNVMIGGLADHGRGQEALELFRKMNADGLKPDGYSFVAVLSACSHAGLVDEGRRFFRAMPLDYGIEYNVLHYACMVDLLGRAGHLEEAMIFIGNMPVEADAATWRILVSACRTYGNVELGELAAKEVLKLEPECASTFVLLSNIYAAAGQWDQVSFIRCMMEERGIRKEPGLSWIEINNKIHRFVVGDTSHPEAKKIYSVLNNLTKKLRAEGYIPDTRLVLRNIDEEDKELALCSHSEKLAIAYGMMHTPVEKPIRVYKNLRVCTDCHTATKFISKVTGREIVARDVTRFHHFKDGVCSCGDYW